MPTNAFYLLTTALTNHYIITLTSIPPRFAQIGLVLDSLLAQSVKPDRVILYLNRKYRRYPEWDGTLPEVPEGVELRLIEEGFGPATKILPALREFGDQDCDILFCDDDQIYRPNMAEWLLNGRRRRPNDCITISGMADYEPLPGTKRKFVYKPRVLRRWLVTHFSYRIRTQLLKIWCRLTGRVFVQPPRKSILRQGYVDGFEGFKGVLVRPSFFPPEVFDIPEFAKPVDDVWLSGHATRAGHPPWVIGGFFEPIIEGRALPAHLDGTALHQNVFDGRDRDQSNLDVVRYFQNTYGIWL